MTIEELYQRTGLALRGFTRLIEKQARRFDALQSETDELRDRVEWLELRLAALEEEKSRC
jgi:polyhydroxyalkanoate synthesis regulator phasin